MYKNDKMIPFNYENGKFKYLFFPKFNMQILQDDQILKISEITSELSLKANIKLATCSREIKIAPNSKEGIYVYMSWIYMWCFTLKEQKETESIFRLNQLIQVIGKLKADYRYNLKVDLFFLLIYTCYHNSSYKISKKIYDTMCQYDVLPDNRIKLMHFDHRREDIKKKVDS